MDEARAAARRVRAHETARVANVHATTSGASTGRARRPPSGTTASTFGWGRCVAAPPRARRDRGIRGVGTTGTGTRTRTRIGMSSRGWGRWDRRGGRRGGDVVSRRGRGRGWTRPRARGRGRRRRTPTTPEPSWGRGPRGRDDPARGSCGRPGGEGRGREASGAREEGRREGPPRAPSPPPRRRRRARPSRGETKRASARGVSWKSVPEPEDYNTHVFRHTLAKGCPCEKTRTSRVGAGGEVCDVPEGFRSVVQRGRVCF